MKLFSLSSVLALSLVATFALSVPQEAYAYKRDSKAPVAETLFGYDQVDDVNILKPAGSPFTNALKLEYNKIANALHNHGYKPLARTFATKGVVSAKGDLVPLEKITEWNKPHMNTNLFTVERARLSKLLDAGARNLSPVNAAIAQGSFDCWIVLESAFPVPEETSADYQRPVPEMKGCEARYKKAVAQIETVLKIPNDAHVSMAKTASQRAQELRQQQTAQASSQKAFDRLETYTVYFGNNSSRLGDVEQAVLQQAAQYYRRNNSKNIIVTGFTDTRGSAAYNKKLSMNRANAVRDALIREGVPATAITLDAQGQKSLAISTRDGVSEERNRRVEITIQ